MANKTYFKHVPDFDYVSRLPNSKLISDYVRTKNLFKRVKLSDEIFGDLTLFNKYTVKNQERPDSVAYSVYKDSNLDWLVMLSNNIVNLQTEWPLDQVSYNNFLLNKYGSTEKINGVHHYETIEILDANENVILPKGLKVPQDFSITYFDNGVERIATNVTGEVSNLVYEDKVQESKTNIYLLRSEYISLIVDDIGKLMQYKEDSTQYVGRSLVRGDNIRLYQ
tara:strand:- start:27 stop:695 length:669 start_codon:yes stop_codon:yes gene_type:complete